MPRTQGCKRVITSNILAHRWIYIGVGTQACLASIFAFKMKPTKARVGGEANLSAEHRTGTQLNDQPFLPYNAHLIAHSSLFLDFFCVLLNRGLG